MAKSKSLLDLHAFATRWRTGESLTTLFREAVSDGFAGKKGKFRRAIQAEIGGKAEFKKLRDAGAGGKSEPFGGQRATGPKIDDTGVKVLVPKTGRLKGWSFRLLREPKRVKLKLEDGTYDGVVYAPTTMIYISPSGNEYVKATNAEKADLIVDYRAKNGSPAGDCRIRFKRFEGSRVARRLDQHEEDLERGRAALKRIRAEKRERRKLRKSKKNRNRES